MYREGDGRSRHSHPKPRGASFLQLIIFLLPLFSPFAVLAHEIPEVFVPIRPIGMGGAYTAVALDESSVWTNPAGVGRVRKARSRKSVHIAKFPNFIIGANSSSRELYSGFQSSQEKNVEQVIQALPDLGNNPFWGRAAAAPAIFFGAGRSSPMAITLFSNTRALAYTDQTRSESTRISAISDMGAVLTMGWHNQTNRLNFGAQVRPMTRYAYDTNIPTVSLKDKSFLQSDFKSNSNKASATAFDVGAMFTLADFWFPTIGVSILNLPTGCKENYINPFTEKEETVCGTLYTGDIANEDALSVVDPTDIRFGVSITPRLHRKFNLRFAADVHHFHYANGLSNYGLSGIEAVKTIHAGLELVMGNPLLINPFNLRVGVNQGFMTAGASMRWRFLSFDFATYGQDVSSTSTSTEDRRYLLGVSMEF